MPPSNSIDVCLRLEFGALDTTAYNCILHMQEAKRALAGTSMSADGKSLIKDGVSYQVGDQVYVHPETFDQLEQAAQAEVPDYAAKGRFHKVSSTVLIKGLLSSVSTQQSCQSLH